MAEPTAASASMSIRARAREEITRQIVETAQRRVASDGAAALSLRAVARDMGMVSSAVYRYVESRDELLTMLIVDAYDAMGAAAERAEAAVSRDALAERWITTCRAVRRWALKRPHSYSLIFGSPVPGYAAPEDTIGPATRVPGLLIAILIDAVGQGRIRNEQPPKSLSNAVRRSLAPIRPSVPAEVSDELLARGLMAWTHLFGAVSFELFGHRHNVIADPRTAREAFFIEEMTTIATLIGLPRPGATVRS